MIKLCIFDLDGTLVNSLQDLASAMNHALSSQGFDAHDTEKYRSFVGSGVSVLADRAALAPNERYTPQIKEKIISDFSLYYNSHCLDSTVPYNGIPELLSELQKRKILFAVNSNKPDVFTKKIVASLFRDIPFAAVCGKRDEFEKKPSPDGANFIMKTLSVRPEETIYIGDSNVDVLTAKNAGTFSCGVSWGFRSVQELISSGAQYVADSPDDILSLIEKL